MIGTILRESKVGIKLHFCIVWHFQKKKKNRIKIIISLASGKLFR